MIRSIHLAHPVDGTCNSGSPPGIHLAELAADELVMADYLALSGPGALPAPGGHGAESHGRRSQPVLGVGYYAGGFGHLPNQLRIGAAGGAAQRNLRARDRLGPRAMFISGPALVGFPYRPALCFTHSGGRPGTGSDLQHQRLAWSSAVCALWPQSVVHLAGRGDRHGVHFAAIRQW